MTFVAVTACGRVTDDRNALLPSDDEPYMSPRGQLIEVTSARDDAFGLLDWAFGQFAAAGLAEPIVDRIRFEPAADRCDENTTGWSLVGERRSGIGICIEGPIATEHLGPRLCLLHELAHLWLADHTGPGHRWRFRNLAGAGSWRNREAAWAEQGVEQAADTVAWGLLGGYHEILGRPLPECSVLPDAFEALTGRAPLTVCAYPGVDGAAGGVEPGITPSGR